MSLQMTVARGGPRGDPGLWGFIKGAAKTGVALVTGGPTAAAATAYQQITGSRARGLPPPVVGASTPWAAPPRSIMPVQNGGRVVRTPGIRGAIERGLPFGRTGYEVAAAPGLNGTMGGYHLNKSGYFLQSGEFVEAGTKWVKNRRRNPGNIKAASRALSRVTATKKALQTFSRVTIRDKDPVKTKTVYKCPKCNRSKCVC